MEQCGFGHFLIEAKTIIQYSKLLGRGTKIVTRDTKTADDKCNIERLQHKSITFLYELKLAAKFQ